jgi:hypothetical protein
MRSPGGLLANNRSWGLGVSSAPSSWSCITGVV